MARGRERLGHRCADVRGAIACRAKAQGALTGPGGGVLGELLDGVRDGSPSDARGALVSPGEGPPGKERDRGLELGLGSRARYAATVATFADVLRVAATASDISVHSRIAPA